MKFRTQLIKITGQKHLHYFFQPDETVCNIPLCDKQKVLKYEIATDEICPKCHQKKSSIPRMKNWNREKVINDGEHAVQLLNRLHVFYNMLDETARVGLGMHQSITSESATALPNWVENDVPDIEQRLDDQNMLIISYRVGDRREERKVSFDDIAEFFNMVKGDLLLELQERKN